MRGTSPSRASPSFKGLARPQQGAPSSMHKITGRLGGDPFIDPGSMYANRADPQKAYGAVLGASPFSSVTFRFGPEEHLEHLRWMQQPPARLRPTQYYHGAPDWDGPFVGKPAAIAVPDNHHELLARARAGAGRQRPQSRPPEESG